VKYYDGGIQMNGTELRDIGIKKALDNADNTHDKWSEKAFNFLKDYIKHNDTFMAEDVRIASVDEVPIPPSKRAWGGVVIRASKAGLIKRVGFSNVKNPQAHATPATVWGVIKGPKTGDRTDRTMVKGSRGIPRGDRAVRTREDDWEVHNYGIDPELGGIYGIDFDDEVGFRD